jgi:hypothetical protein
MEKTQEGMGQIVVLINAMLDELVAISQWSSDEFHELGAALRDFHYNGENALELKEMMESFSDKVGYLSSYYFNLTLSLLPLLAIFEKGGLEAVNQRISDHLNVLRDETASEQEVESAAYALNDILFTAIYLFPHLVQGVRVRLADRLLEEDHITRLVRYDDRRWVFNKMVAMYPQERGHAFPGEFILPLPYGFTTGTHGSGERAAMGASRAELHFSMTAFCAANLKSIPVLEVAVERPLITYKHAMFLPDEIASVELIATGEYTPYYSKGFRDHSPKKETLIDRCDPIMQYLQFRDFVYCRLQDERMPKNLSSDELKVCGNLLVPDIRSAGYLWKVGKRHDRVRSGYMVLQSGQDYSLCVLSDIKTNNVWAIDENAVRTMVGVMRQKKKVLTKVKSHPSTDIIGTLFEVPVAKRNF